MNNAAYRPSHRPPARMSQGNDIPPRHSLRSYPASRAQVWLSHNAGMLLVGIGEALAFVPIVANAVNPYAGTGAEWFICSAMLIGSGIGWIVRDERDRDER